MVLRWKNCYTIFNCADVPNYIHLAGCPNARFIVSISALCHISCLKHQDSASNLLLATGCLKGIGSKFSDKIRLSSRDKLRIPFSSSIVATLSFRAYRSMVRLHMFAFLTLCFLCIVRMRYFRPDAGKNGKKRTKINILLIDSVIHKYVQL